VKHVIVIVSVGAAVVAMVAAAVDFPAGSAPAGESRQPVPAAVPVHGYEVVRAYPHDPDAFTQGLIFRDGFLYESTGLEGRSSLRKVEIETGRVLQRRDIERPYFAEGLTDWGAQLLQLTYTSNIGFVYDLGSFEPRGTFAYAGQGWGLTRDDRRLIMSDGSSSLRFLDPVTRREQGRVPVRDRGRAVEDLNELEFVRGEVYANVWHTERIAVIRPDSGDVTAWINLAGIKPAAATDPEAVLNGIAYDAARDRLFVTGKLWPRLYEIRVRAGARP
jgi:glutamine cyclotransferase